MNHCFLKKLCAFLLAFAFVFGMSPAFLTASAGDVIVFDASDLESRTIDEVAARYSELLATGDSYNSGNSSTWYTVPASTSAPYNAGVLTDDTLAVMHAYTNIYRWLSGLPEYEGSDQHSDESLQAQALDRNFDFNHSISNDKKPEDMDQELWDKGFAGDNNVIAKGYNPHGSIISWINEGYNTNISSWDSTLHRYNLLSPRYTGALYGYSGLVSVGKMTGFNRWGVVSTFAAYPAPGCVPTELIRPKTASWSLQINSDVIEVDTEAVAVSITNKTTGDVYARTRGDNTLHASADSLNFIQPPVSGDSYNGSYTGEFSVVITGLKEKSTGKTAEIRYTVNFVEMKNYAVSKVVDYGSKLGTIVVSRSMADTDNLNKIGSILEDKITLICKSGYYVEVPVKGRWTLEQTDENGGFFVNSVDPKEIPALVTDEDGILNKLKYPYIVSDDEKESKAVFTFKPEEYNTAVCPWGTEVEFNCNAPRSSRRGIFYRITEESPGVYTSEQIYDSDYHTDGTNARYYRYESFKKTVTEADSGEYIAIYYGYYDGLLRSIVSSSTQTLRVTHQNHSYTEQNVSPEFLKSEANCKSPAVYYYSCSCGLHSEETFEYGEIGTHVMKVTVKEPTEEVRGFTSHRCKYCDYLYEDAFVPALGGGLVLKPESSYYYNGYFVENVQHETKKSAFLTNFEIGESDVTWVWDISGSSIQNSGLVGTGSQIDYYKNNKRADTRIMVVPGDNSGDGIVDVVDVKLALNASLGKEELSDVCFLASDVDKNGLIDVVDVKLILNVSLGKQKTFAE